MQPTFDASQADASQADAPQVDAPQVDASQVDASQADASLADASLADASLADAPPPDAASPTRLVAHWRFDEPSGTVAADSVGTADGTLSGDAVLGAAGTVGGAITIGDNDGDTYGGYVEFTVAELPVGIFDEIFTVSFWFRGGDQNQVMFASGSHEGILVHVGQWSPETLDIFIGSLHYTANYVVPTDGQWHQLVFETDCTPGPECNTQAWIDDTLVVDERNVVNGTNAFDPTSITKLYLGALRSDGYHSFVGLFDDLRIYRGPAPSHH